MKLVFLGTGGGRFTTITQRLHTAGIRLIGDQANVHLDPGPGALVHSWRLGLDPQKLDGILVSHAHPDHYTDAEILIEAMTFGTFKRRGVLAASKSVLDGGKTAEVAISKYHQSLPVNVVEVISGKDFEAGNARVVGAEARHSDADAVGFRLETNAGGIGYTSDTEFFDGIDRHYRGVRVLVLCVLRPSGSPWSGHMTTEDATKIVKAVSPELAVLTHFGMKMIFAGPGKEARIIEKETGVKTVAAKDGMELVMGSNITLGSAVNEEKSATRLDSFLE